MDWTLECVVCLVEFVVLWKEEADEISIVVVAL